MTSYSHLRTRRELLLCLGYLICPEILFHELGHVCMNLLPKSMRFLLCTNLLVYIRKWVLYALLAIAVYFY